MRFDTRIAADSSEREASVKWIKQALLELMECWPVQRERLLQG
jgi:hypothetical protein